MRLAPVVVLALLVAGCVSDNDVPAAPRTYSWGLSDCAFVIASVAVPEAAVQPLLPPGFRPAPARSSVPAPVPPVAPVAPMAEFHVDAYSCAGGVGLAGENLTGVAYGSYYVPVVPPDALREEGYDAYFVKLDTLIHDTGRRAVLERGGLPVHAGHVRVTGAAGPGAWHAELAMGEDEGFVLDGIADEPAEDGPLPFMEYTPLAGGGLARWHARLHDASITQGNGLLQPQGLARQVIGSDAVPASFIAGTWNLDEADVTFPVTWP